jgi:hypothetical protein
MANAATTKPAVGTPVIIRPECDPDMKYYGIVWKVAEVPARGKFITLEAIGNGAKYLGGARRGRFEPSLVTTEVPDGYDKDTTETCVSIPIFPLYHVGQVFTVPAGVLPGVDEDTLMVITGLAGDWRVQSYSAVKLGGDFDDRGDRWFKKVAAAAIRLVPLSDIPSYLS